MPLGFYFSEHSEHSEAEWSPDTALFLGAVAMLGIKGPPDILIASFILKLQMHTTMKIPRRLAV